MDTDKKLPEDYDDGEVLSKYRSKEFSQKAEDITGSHEEFAEEIVIENMDYESESEGEHINHLRQTGLVSLKQFEFVKVPTHSPFWFRLSGGALSARSFSSFTSPLGSIMQ